jgi:GNAT superfamily N-acetyltransferase
VPEDFVSSEADFSGSGWPRCSVIRRSRSGSSAPSSCARPGRRSATPASTARPASTGSENSAVVEIGYTTFEPFRGRGLATEAVSALMGWARKERDVGRFILSISPDNAPSLVIARKLGFVQTGEQWDDDDGLELVFELEA